MQHLGHFVRENVFPAGINVKDAAEILGVGRPALSTFLNGKAALSAEMALRLEKSFGANAAELLKMQIEFDKQSVSIEDTIRPPISHVPLFLRPKAIDFEQWAEQSIFSRVRLAVFRCSVDGYEHIEPSFFSVDLRNVDMEEADRILFEGFGLSFFLFFFRKSGYPVVQKHPMKIRSF